MNLVETWRTEWRSRGFRPQLAGTLLATILTLSLLTRFLNWVEDRPGVVLQDPFLQLFAPVDLTWLTFALIYGGLVLGIFHLARRPQRLLLALQCYIVMVIFRIIAMWLLPLEPPATMIILRDPTVEILGTGQILTKDLFFSGHTSTMLLLSLTAYHRTVRTLFLICTVAVGTCVLLQHTHYAVDVYVAPFVAYAAYRIVVLVRRALLPESEPGGGPVGRVT